jgi:tetratricopeptide (TPR) repeat protein
MDDKNCNSIISNIQTIHKDAIEGYIRGYSAKLLVKNDWQAVLKRGKLYLLLFQYDLAEKDFHTCIKWCNEVPDPYYFLATIANKQCDYEKAVEYCTIALQKYNDKQKSPKLSRSIWSSLGSVSSNVRKKKNVVTESITSALSSQNTSKTLVEKHKSQNDAEDQIQSFIYAPVTMASVYSSRYAAHQNMYNYDDALSDSLSALSVSEEDQPKHLFYYQCGLACFYNDDLTNAEKYFTLAIQESPTPLYYVQRACTYDRMYEPEKSKADRDTATEMYNSFFLEPFHYRRLPEDVFSNVLSFLEQNSMIRVARSSRSLYKTVMRPHLWYHAEFKWTRTDTFDVYLSSLQQKTNSVDHVVALDGAPKTFQHPVIPKIRKFHLLQTRDYNNEYLMKDLEKCDLTELQSLRLHYFYNHIYPENQGTFTFMMYLPTVTDLALYNVALSKDQLRHILSICTKLEKLSLKRIGREIDYEDVQIIMDTCLNLKSLKIDVRDTKPFQDLTSRLTWLNYTPKPWPNDSVEIYGYPIDD